MRALGLANYSFSSSKHVESVEPLLYFHESMGIIKDGSVSGKLPTNKVFAVHYPAYLLQWNVLLRLLVVFKVCQVSNQSQISLELHFHEDPYSHPAFGELKHSNNFLLKISKKKRQWAEVEPKFEKGGLMDVDQEDLMILLPPLFSSKDLPDNIVLKSCTSVSSKSKKGRHNWERRWRQVLQLILLSKISLSVFVCY
ncbi:hypothetical protein HAX54_003791 [Datura stramonium]|uniref:Transcription factor IIIC subunit Tfc1/Sfc1 triple barrel domain-containing protein n=1 Tax=Datura stramonium TaxID=4076 RepID=A0ABS8WUT9_DATST|nr:hypothetical protein [Datura stramonium]